MNQLFQQTVDKADQVLQDVAVIKRLIDLVERRFEDHEGRLRGVENNITKMTGSLQQLEKDFSVVRDDVKLGIAKMNKAAGVILVLAFLMPTLFNLLLKYLQAP